MQRLLGEVNEQLREQGIYIKTGTVERVFGVLKQHDGMAKGRYLGIDRNRARVELMGVAHNIKRALSIRQESYA